MSGHQNCSLLTAHCSLLTVTVQLSERGEFGFDFGESGLEGFAADGAGGALVENAFALDFQRLTLEGAGGFGGVDSILTRFGVG
jgi:hypothetical protein